MSTASAQGRRDSAADGEFVLHVDGGARGNPGPAAIGAVLSRPDGEVVATVCERIGVSTNNVAEYRALLRGLELAAAHGARALRVVCDSELMARQLTGAYRVRHASLRELHARALAALSRLERWSVEAVPRAQNARADALVNAALDR